MEESKKGPTFANERWCTSMVFGKVAEKWTRTGSASLDWNFKSPTMVTPTLVVISVYNNTYLLLLDKGVRFLTKAQGCSFVTNSIMVSIFYQSTIMLAS
ncbi:hypothetical protein V6N12_030100 [Hibiscus sabdariffa]|uniref:Uncharacterized protein n=1 Tax=Hibiscus sabdariffa TaxID=183260 RepID=A0ABR2ANN3_9ROSI